MNTKTRDFAQGFTTEDTPLDGLAEAKNIAVTPKDEVGLAADDVQEALEDIHDEINKRALLADTYSADDVDGFIATRQPLDDNLTAISGLTQNGIICRTGDGTAAARTIAAGSSRIEVTNGDGASGNPTIDIAEDLLDSLLPDQTGSSGKFLSTNGAQASWMGLPLASLSTPGLISAENNVIEGDLGTLSWSSNVSNPSGTTTKRFKCIQVGKVVHFWFRVTHSVAGSNVTNLAFDLPAACPAPANLSNQQNSAVVAHGTGSIMWDEADDFSFPGGCVLYKNFLGAYEVRLTSTWLLLYNIGVSPIDESMGGGAAMGYLTYFTT